MSGAGDGVVSKLLRAARALVRGLAYLTLFVAAWLTLELPLGVDRWLDVSERPAKAEAIVCVAGGTTAFNTPLDHGWERVYTSAQLYADAYAPYVIFTGRGSGTISEAEAYRDAGLWLGLPADSTVLEPSAQSTGDHPRGLLSLTLPNGTRVTRETPLLLVTSDYHTRRVLMTFHKAGFRNVRAVAWYWSRRSESRHARRSGVSYTPSGKAYDDPMLRLAVGSTRLMAVAREFVAIGWYRMQGLL